MKAVILAVTLISSTAVAAEWTRDNDNGGKIHLTEEKCPNTSGDYFAFAWVKTGERMEGCWIRRGNMAFINWETGLKQAHPLEKFEMTLPTKRYPGDK